MSACACLKETNEKLRITAIQDTPLNLRKQTLEFDALKPMLELDDCNLNLFYYVFRFSEFDCLISDDWTLNWVLPTTTTTTEPSKRPSSGRQLIAVQGYPLHHCIE